MYQALRVWCRVLFIILHSYFLILVLNCGILHLSMKWRILFGIVLALLFVSAGAYVWLVASISQEPLATVDLLPPLPQSPRDATYNIDGDEITLLDGHFERVSAPGSATRDTYTIWGEEVRGDANVDGTEDALLWLTYNGGGSGTFYYLAVATWDMVGFRGSNTIPLGDRITPVSLNIWYDTVRVTYRTHAEGQSLAESPTTEVTRFFMVQGAQIIELGSFMSEEQILVGTMTWADGEVSVTPCGAPSVAVDPDSRARPALEAIYKTRHTGQASSTPVFVVLAGTYDTPTQATDEGATSAFNVDSVLSAPESGTCKERSGLGSEGVSTATADESESVLGATPASLPQSGVEL